MADHSTEKANMVASRLCADLLPTGKLSDPRRKEKYQNVISKAETLTTTTAQSLQARKVNMLDVRSNNKAATVITTAQRIQPPKG